MNQYLEAGKIINTHGVKGDVKIESWCDTPEVLCSLPFLYIKKGEAFISKTPVKAVPFKGMTLFHFEGCDSFDDANLLKNKTVYAKREDLMLEEGSFFIADLIGLSVYNAESGKIYGKIADVLQGAAGEIYEIDTPAGKAYMPAVPEFIREINLEKGISVTPIEGIFDEI